jgi:hypothetical protein
MGCADGITVSAGTCGNLPWRAADGQESHGLAERLPGAIAPNTRRTTIPAALSAARVTMTC